jgi:hypothetical protein
MRQSDLNALRQQALSVLRGEEADGAGLLSLSMVSESADTRAPSPDAERLHQPMRAVRQLEMTLRRTVGVDLEASEIGTDEIVAGAEVMREVLDDGELEHLAFLRAAARVNREIIVRGYLDTLCSKPAITRLDTPLLYAVIQELPDGDSLLRENHGFGYHYHYSDDGRRRADIILTFSRDPNAAKKPVMWEPHAVKKADFDARVPRWGDPKRWSVHHVCVGDFRPCQQE